MGVDIVQYTGLRQHQAKSERLVYLQRLQLLLDRLHRPRHGQLWQSFSQTFGNSIIDFTTKDYAFFVQDQFRVSQALTLNYGFDTNSPAFSSRISRIRCYRKQRRFASPARISPLVSGWPIPS